MSNNTWSSLPALDGKEFGDYTILKEVARGGMGIVYLARQKSMERNVALKILLSGSDAEGVEVKRFFREAKLLAELQHPNIIPIYSMGEEQGFHYFTMKYVAGGTLEDFLQNPDLSLKDKIQKVIPVVQALHTTHRKGICHRDIKPSNILVDVDGTPFLTDFGLAKSAHQSMALTRSNDILGTPFYMSPEQIRSRKDEIGPSSDIYSLGVLLYQLATKKLPFHAKSLAELFAQVEEVDPTPPSKMFADVSPSFDYICLKAMQKQIKNRYASAKLLAQDLDNFCQDLPVEAAKERWTMWFRWHFRHYRLHYAVVFLAILSLLIWNFFSASQPTTPAELWKVAHHAYKNKKFTEALEHSETILLRDPNHRLALLLKSTVLQKRQSWEDARFTWMRISEVSGQISDFEKITYAALKQGYLEEAKNYAHKGLKLAESALLRSFLGDILLYQGKVENAESYYQTAWENPKNTVKMRAVFGLAAVSFEYRNYEQANKFLNLLGDDLSLSLKAQSTFLKAKILWAYMQQDIMIWESLFEQENFIQEHQGELSKIHNLLLLAEQYLESSEDYLLLKQKEEIQDYLIVLNGELEVPGPEKKWFQELEKKRFTGITRNSLYLAKSYLRSLVRMEKWNLLYKETSEQIKKFPGEKDFYHFRLLSGYHLPEMDDWDEDIVSFTLSQDVDLTPIGNLFLLFSERPEQAKFYEVYPKVLANFIGMLAYQDHLDNFYQKEHARFQAENYQLHEEQLSQVSTEVLEKLWKKYLSTSLTSVRTITAETLSKYYQTSFFQEKWNSLSDSVRKEELQKLVEVQQRKKEKLLLLQIMQEYALYFEDRYLIEAYHTIPNLLALLEQIALNAEKPYLRLVAVRMLKDLQMEEGDQIIANLYRQGYPYNLLVLSVTQDREKFSVAQCPEAIFSQEDYFYLVNAALCLSIEQHQEFFQRCLKKNDDFITLAVTQNLRNGTPLPSFENIVIPRMARIIQQGSLYHRTIAQSVFWDLDTLSENEIGKYWHRYSYLMLHGLKDPNDQVKLSVLRTLLTRRAILKYVVTYSDPRWLQVVQEFSRHRKVNASYTVRFMSAFMEYFTYDNGRVGEELVDPNVPYIIKMAIYFGSFSRSRLVPGSSNQRSMFVAFQKYERVQPKTKSDYRMRRFLASTRVNLLPRSFGRISFRKTSSKMNRIEDVDLRRTLISSALWLGGKHDIASLEKTLAVEKVPNIRRSIIASLSGLYLIHQPKKIASWNKRAMKKSKSYRSTVAFAYYSLILRSFGIFEYISFDSYDGYLHHFRNRIQKKWISYLRQCIKIYPTPRYYYEIALCFVKWKRYELANQALDKARAMLQKTTKTSQVVKYQPLVDQLQYQIYLENNQLEDAHDILSKMLKNNFLSADLCFRMGVLVEKIPEYKDKAPFYFRQAEKLSSDYEVIFYNPQTISGLTKGEEGSYELGNFVADTIRQDEPQVDAVILTLSEYPGTSLPKGPVHWRQISDLVYSREVLRLFTGGTTYQKNQRAENHLIRRGMAEMEINGAVLLELLDYAIGVVSRFHKPYFQVSGMKMHIRDGKVSQVELGGKPVDKNRVYRVILGSSIPVSISSSIPVRKKSTLIDAFVDSVKRHGLPKTSKEKRVTISSE